MREIEVELMRRDIWALRHEAHVAQGASVNDGFEIGAIDGIELSRLGLVDQIEEPGKAVAQVEAAPASMTDVENAAQFFI